MNMIDPEMAAAIRDRRAHSNDHLIAAHTKGGTYVIASSGKWNDNGKPRDLIAILPGDLGQGQVIALYVAVNPALVAEVETLLSVPEHPVADQPRSDDDGGARAAAWADYRAAYGVHGTQSHRDFCAGWDAARGKLDAEGPLR